MGVNYDFMDNIHTTLRYLGSCNDLTEMKNPKVGDVCVVATSDGYDNYVYIGDNWEPIGSDVSTKEDHKIVKEEDHKIVKEICDSCGAPLPLKMVTRDGTCTCEFCKRVNYVWEIEQ